MKDIYGLERHERLENLLEKVEKRIEEKDAEDAAFNMRKALEYLTLQYVNEYAQQLSRKELSVTITELRNAGVISQSTADFFHKIRSFGNSGAHISNREVSLSKAKQYYNELLNFIPHFLEEIGEPSAAQRTSTPQRGGVAGATFEPNIDYLQIYPLRVALSDYKEILNLNYYSDPKGKKIHDLNLWHKYADKLQWILKDHNRYFYTENGELFINRFQMVIDYIDDINSFLKTGNSHGYNSNELYIPGIIQEYIGYSCVSIKEVDEVIQGPNGMTAVRRNGRKQRKVVYSRIDGGRIIYELAAFNDVVHIPECVTEVTGYIDNSVFKRTTAVYLPPNLNNFSWINSFPKSNRNVQVFINDSEETCIENGMIYTENKKKLLYATMWIPKSVSIPKETEIICKEAFKGNNYFNHIKMENVKEIEEEAFCDCKELVSVWLPFSLRNVGKMAFAGCSRLRYVSLDNTNTTFSNDAFKDCLTIENSFVPVIEHGTYNIRKVHPEIITTGSFFSYTFKTTKYIWDTGDYLLDYLEIRNMGEKAQQINEIFIPEGVTRIHDLMRGLGSLKRVVLPRSLKIIDNMAFKDCGLEEIVIPDGVQKIKQEAFAGNLNLKKVIIPGSSLEIIDKMAFKDCGLEEVVILDGAQKINQEAFAGNLNLKKVKIPGSVYSIYGTAFKDCPSLEEVEVREEFRWVFKNYPNIRFTTPPPTKYEPTEDNIASTWRTNSGPRKGDIQLGVEIVKKKWEKNAPKSPKTNNVVKFELTKEEENKLTKPIKNKTVAVGWGKGERPEDLYDFIDWLVYCPVWIKEFDTYYEKNIPTWAIFGANKYNMTVDDFIELVRQRKGINFVGKEIE